MSGKKLIYSGLDTNKQCRRQKAMLAGMVPQKCTMKEPFIITQEIRQLQVLRNHTYEEEVSATIDQTTHGKLHKYA